jgi:hypothetical protein
MRESRLTETVRMRCVAFPRMRNHGNPRGGTIIP